jgi:hypothetical protein
MSNHQNPKIEWLARSCRLIRDALGPTSAFELHRARLVESANQLIELIEGKDPNPLEAINAAQELGQAGSLFAATYAQVTKLIASLKGPPQN